MEETSASPYKHGDRVEWIRNHYYGVGTIRFLDGDLMPDGSGRNYNWPDQVCVEFDREIAGEKPGMWCKYDEIRRAE